MLIFRVGLPHCSAYGGDNLKSTIGAHRIRQMCSRAWLSVLLIFVQPLSLQFSLIFFAPIFWQADGSWHMIGQTFRLHLFLIVSLIFVCWLTRNRVISEYSFCWIYILNFLFMVFKHWSWIVLSSFTCWLLWFIFF